MSKYCIGRHKETREYHLLLKQTGEVLGRFKTRKEAETEAMMRVCNEASAQPVVTAGEQR
jgi:hypothetical protein